MLVKDRGENFQGNPGWRWEWGHLVLMLIAAAAFRFPQLGMLGFYGDEELTALAVQGALSEGYPHMPSGMAYWRGAFYTYLAAGSAMLFGLSEFSIRLPSAIFGSLTIPVVYELGKRLIGRLPSILAAWLLVFSGWHIDISREGRMYAVFLFFFLLCLMLFYLGFVQGRRAFLIGAALTAALTITLHEMGVLILAFWALAYAIRPFTLKYRRVLVITTFGLGLFWYVYRHLSKLVIPGASFSEATDSVPGTDLLKLLHLEFTPRFFMLKSMVEQHPILYAFILGLGILMAWKVWRMSRDGQVQENIWWWTGLFIACSMLNLFGLALMALVIFGVWKPGEIGGWLKSPPFRMVVLYGALMFLLWFSYGVLFWKGGGIEELSGWSLVKQSIKDSLYYPALHIQTYWEAFPVMTFFICLGSMLWALGLHSGAQSDIDFKTVFVWFWFLLLGLGFTQEWITLRYTLPLYPIYLMIFAMTTLQLVRLGVLTISRVAPQALTADRNPNRVIMAVLIGMLLFPFANEQHGVREALAWSQLTYGQGVSSSLHGFSFHPDHRSAGQYVRSQLAGEDLVVAMDVQQQKYYVGRVDYWLMETSNAERFSYAEGGGRRDIYTGSRVLQSLSELQVLLEGRQNRRVWVITSAELTEKLEKAVPSGVQNYLEKQHDRLVFVGRDSMTRVYLFDTAEKPYD